MRKGIQLVVTLQLKWLIFPRVYWNVPRPMKFGWNTFPSCQKSAQSQCPPISTWWTRGYVIHSTCTPVDHPCKAPYLLDDQGTQWRWQCSAVFLLFVWFPSLFFFFHCEATTSKCREGYFSTKAPWTSSMSLGNKEEQANHFSIWIRQLPLV